MRHEGYLGAIGAFIKGAEEEAGIGKIIRMEDLIQMVMSQHSVTTTKF